MGSGMAQHTVTARGMVRGTVRGPALVCRQAFSFLGDVDMDTGQIIAKGHEHEGECIAGRVMIYPETKGSSGGCVVLTVLAKQGKQPAAIVLEKPADPNIVEGAIVTGVTLVCEPTEDLLTAVPNGALVTVNGSSGQVSWAD
jgi:predicted aconitase with swiveling domain